MEFQIRSDETVSVAVVRAVAERRGEDSRSLPPLGAVIDTDALNVLFDPPQASSGGAEPKLSFQYHGCRITVVDGTTLRVESAAESTE